MDTYHEAMTQLGRKVVQLLALALNMPEDYFNQSFTKPIALIRLLHYNETPSDPAAGILAAGAHTDYGMITLLATDQEPGLQVFNEDSQEWIDVPPREGAFVVNLGDMLAQWSNDLFHSAKKGSRLPF